MVELDKKYPGRSIIDIPSSLCLGRFKEEEDTHLFHNYGTPWILPQERAPAHLREDICYSRCIYSDTSSY